MAASTFYHSSDTSDALRQGEVLSSVIQLFPAPGTPIDRPTIRREVHEFAVLMSQDCDLSTDHASRTILLNADSKPKDVEKAERKLLKFALLCEVLESKQFFQNVLTSGDPKDPVKKNDDFRFHCLQEIEPTSDSLKIGIPTLVVSFKRYFTVPMDDLLKRIELGETIRRSRMESPYFEHLLHRFGYYLSRVGLPVNHDIS